LVNIGFCHREPAWPGKSKPSLIVTTKSFQYENKFKFLLATCVIATVAITGFNFVQNGNSIDVSLADIAVMAHADSESGKITEDCSNNITGPGTYTFTECEEDCPSKEGSTGPQDGTCTTYF
jgi:hypothetical protein